MARAPLPCGTNAAYIRHIRKKEEVCEPCRLAHRAENRKKWNIAPPAVKAKQKSHRQVRYAATARLIENHPEFPALMDGIRAGGHPGGDVRNEAIRRLIAAHREEFDAIHRKEREWADLFAEFTTKEET